MEKKDEEKKISNSNFIDAFKNAFNGLIYAMTTQSNIKKQLIITCIVMTASLFFNLTTTEFLCLIFSVFLVIFAEMCNTAIETLVDLFTNSYHPKAKIAKDLGAGAVLLMSINSVIIAYFIFFRKIILEKSGQSILSNIAKSPLDLTFVGIILLSIVAISMVALIKTKKPKNNKIEKKIIIINGCGGVGKDTFVDLCKEFARVRNISSVDKVKDAAKILVGWNGEKDDKSRKFLSDLKQMSVDYNDYPLTYIKEQAEEFRKNGYETIMFIHIREISEIEKVKNAVGAKTLLVTNNRVEKINTNVSDANVENYIYDFYIENNGTLEELRDIAENFIKTH